MRNETGEHGLPSMIPNGWGVYKGFSPEKKMREQGPSVDGKESF